MDQKEESMKLVCWSLVGLILMGIAFALSAFQTAKELTREQTEQVQVEELTSYPTSTNKAIHAFPECRGK